VTALGPDGDAPMPDSSPPPTRPGGTAQAARLVFLVIVALLALLFFATFGGQIPRMQPGLGDSEIIYGAPQPAAESPS
jgi:hypothetical protein